jgi:ankyrin repeat protein
MDGHTPLLIASANGFWDTAKTLLEARADVNKVNTNGATPLYIASTNGFRRTAKLLLDHGANVNQPDNDGYPPLYMVCWQGRAKMAKVLLDNGANVDQGVTDGATPLYVACREGRADTVKVLLDFGADPNIVITNRFARYEEEETPFYIACYLSRVEIVTILLGHNIHTTMFYVDFDVDDVVERNEWCLPQGLLQQVLQFAIDKNLWKALENVLNIYKTYNKPSPTISQNSNELSLLHYAIQQFKVSDLGPPSIRKILTNANPRLPFNMLQYILLNVYGTNIFNCSFGIILKHYTQNDISLDEQDADGNTPLHMAATLGHVEIVQQLLNAGANPVIEDMNEIRSKRQKQGMTWKEVQQKQETLLTDATKQWQETKQGSTEPQSPPPPKPKNGIMSNLQQNLAL